MKILGIDPGYDKLGIAIIEKLPSHKETVLYSDCLKTSPKDPIYKRFLEIGTGVSKIMDEYKPDSLSIETLFISANQKTGMRVSEVRGIIIYEASHRNIPIFEYSPMHIKSTITGDGSSDKTRMIKMLNMLVKLPKVIAQDDEYDAIAVALTHSAQAVAIPNSNLLQK